MVSVFISVSQFCLFFNNSSDVDSMWSACGICSNMQWIFTQAESAPTYYITQHYEMYNETERAAQDDL